MDIEAMRAERDRLDAQIREAEKLERANWNIALDACEEALGTWLRERKVEYTTRERKNTETWDVGHGALEVTFVSADEQYGQGGLRMVSGRTLTLEWSEVPEPARMLAVVAVLLNVKDLA
jgi:hypothetical protein